MGYSNGQLETSSGTGQGERGEPGLPGIGFNLTMMVILILIAKD